MGVPVTRPEVARELQDQAAALITGNLRQEPVRVLVEYGRAIAELALDVPPDTVLTRWQEGFYEPCKPGEPGYNRAVLRGEEPWR